VTISSDQYFRLIIKSDGSAYIQNIDGSNVEPEAARTICNKIEATANTPAYVYVGYDKWNECYKIGWSRDPEKRGQRLGIDILFTYECELWGKYSARKFECLLHYLFKQAQTHLEGEWFNLQAWDVWLLNRISCTLS
jgi:hypothetical protein